MTEAIREDTPERKLLQVLVIDDMAIDAELMVRELERYGFAVGWQRVDSAPGLRKALASCAWDIVLSDYAMPSFNGLEALEIVKASGLDLPFILISGAIGEETAVQAMRDGASDYLLKDRLARLGPAVEQALRETDRQREHMRVQEALRESERRFFQLFDQAPLGYQSLDERGCFITVNQACLETLGYSQEEVIGKWFGDFLAPEYVEAFRQRFPAFIAAGKIHSEFEMLNKNGNRQYIAFEGRIGRNSDGSFQQTHCILEDITERVQAEKKLRESEARYRLLFERTNDAIFLLDGRTGRYLDANRAAEILTGRTARELKQLTTRDVSPKEAAQRLNKMKDLKEPIDLDEVEFIRPDGTRRVALLDVVPLSENVFYGIAHDITERKRTEEELRRSEERYRAVAETAIAGIGIMDHDEKFTFVNAALADMLGYTQEEIIGRNLVQFTTPNQFSIFQEFTGRRKAGKSNIYETVLLHKDGRQLSLLISASPLFSDDGSLLGTLGVMVDITERKQAEEALKESEVKYRTLFEEMISGFALHEIVCNQDGEPVDYITLEVNKEYEILLNTRRKEIVGKKAYETVPNLDRHWLDIIGKVALTGKPYYYEQYASNLNKWFEGIAFRPKEGQFAVTFVDITGRKLAEEKHAREHEKLELRLKYEILLADIASHLNSSGSFLDSMDDLLGKIGAAMGVHGAGFFRFDDNYEVAVRLNRWASTADGELVKCPATVSASKAAGLFNELKKNKLFYAGNISESGREEKSFFSEYSIKSAMISPLSISGQVKGFMSLVNACEHLWQPEEINVYKTIADMIVSAWERDTQVKALLDLERKQTEAVRMAEQTSRMASIGVMAGGITHEINQPLNAIKITADCILMWDDMNKGILPGDFSDWLKTISLSVDRIDEIIQHMRSFWLPTDRMVKETIDLSETTRKALSLIDAQLYNHGINTKIKLEKSPLFVLGINVHLEQVIVNLIINSMQALDRADVADKKIKVNTRRKEGHAILEIQDNGPGLPKGSEEKVFDPFFSTRKEEGGTGLGLAIVKQFVTEHDGLIKGGNNKSGGAKFIVKLPLYNTAQEI